MNDLECHVYIYKLKLHILIYKNVCVIFYRGWRGTGVQPERE